jgi:hypothetical protein
MSLSTSPPFPFFCLPLNFSSPSALGHFDGLRRGGLASELIGRRGRREEEEGVVRKERGRSVDVTDGNTLG